jgi:uncharacterized repeat protein (TIGR01451 family)
MYVKNLTDTWFRKYYYGQTADRYADSSKIPTPAAQSATIKVYAMAPGTYTVEKWSTTETNKALQVLSKSNITVGSDGIATVSVTSLAVDIGIKIKQISATTTKVAVTRTAMTTPQISGTDEDPTLKPNVTISLSANRKQAASGDLVTYTVTYSNPGTGPASDVVVTVPVPNDATFVAATSGGEFNASTREVTWMIPTLAPGETGNVTFQVMIK